MQEKFGYQLPEFITAKSSWGESKVADLIAKTEADFLLWLKHAVFAKPVKERGSLSMVDGKVVLVVREPRTGIRRACYVENSKFLNDVHTYLSLVGSGPSRS